MEAARLSRRELDRLRRLRDRPSARQAEGRLVVEGPRALAAALAAGAEIEVVLAGPGAEGSCRDVLDRARRGGIPVRRLASGELERVAATVTPQPVLAVARRPSVPLEEALAGDLLVVAVDVADPGNAGTLLRSASAGSASAVIFSRGSVDLTNPKTVRASAGTLFSVPVVEGAEPREVLGAVGAHGFTRLGAVAREGRPYDEVDLTGPVALVLGNEARGLSPALSADLDDLITIPMAARAESLNLAVAASVLLFEVGRQRRSAGRTRPLAPGLRRGRA